MSTINLKNPNHLLAGFSLLSGLASGYLARNNRYWVVGIALSALAFWKREQIIFNAGVGINEVKYALGRHRFDRIKGTNMIVSSLPTEAMIKKFPNNIAVLSVVNPKEFTWSWFKKFKKDFNVPHKTIVTEDFEPLSKESINAGLAFLDEHQDKAVVIHCKSGVGRSATIAVAKMMKDEGWSLEDAMKYIAKYRTCINLNARQQKAIEDWSNALPKSKKGITSRQRSIKDFHGPGRRIFRTESIYSNSPPTGQRGQLERSSD